MGGGRLTAGVSSGDGLYSKAQRGIGYRRSPERVRSLHIEEEHSSECVHESAGRHSTSSCADGKIQRIFANRKPYASAPPELTRARTSGAISRKANAGKLGRSSRIRNGSLYAAELSVRVNACACRDLLRARYSKSSKERSSRCSGTKSLGQRCSRPDFWCNSMATM